MFIPSSKISSWLTVRDLLVASIAVLTVAGTPALADEQLSLGNKSVVGLSSIDEGLVRVFSQVITKNPQVLIKQSELKTAGYELDAADWGRYPTLGLDSQLRSGQREAVARIEQPLWTGGKINGQVRLSSAGEKQAKYALVETQLRLMLETADVYFDILRLDSRLTAAEDNVIEHAKLQGLIERRVAAQINPETDLVLASSRMSQAINDKVTLKRQLSDAKVKLENLLGESLKTVSVPAEILSASRSLLWLEQKALAFSPTRKRLLAEVDKASAETRLARSQVMPSLVLGYEQRFSNQNDASVDNNQVYLALNVQTGAGLSSVATVNAAASRRTAVLDSISSHERELKQSIDSEWIKAETFAEQLIPIKSTVAASEEVVASYLRQFRVGKKSWLDVMNAQREKVQSYNLLADTQMPLQLSRLRLLLLTGQIIPDGFWGNVNND